MTAEDYEIIMQEVRKTKDRTFYKREGNRLIIYDDLAPLNELELLQQEYWEDSKVMFKEAMANLDMQRKISTLSIKSSFVSFMFILMLVGILFVINNLMR